MQELFDWISDNSHKSMYDGKMFSTELSVTDILQKAESLLEKEEEVMCEFATAYTAQDQHKTSAKEYYNQTFNTKER